MDRGQARDRDAGRQLEDLLREVQHVLRLPSRRVHHPERGRDRSEPGPGLRLRLDRHPGRCRRAGRTTPTRTSTSTPRAARTRRRCRSTRSGRAACTRTARSTSPTATTSALHWVKGNGGRDLEPNNNQTSLSFGHVEDKQWIAVNHFPGTAFQDHVYAVWTTFNGAAGNGKIRLAVSRDRGQTFPKPITITPPGVTTPATTYVYPSVGSRRDALRRVRRRLRHDQQEPRRARLRDALARRRRDVRPVRRGGDAGSEPGRLPARTRTSATGSSRLRRQSDLSRPRLPDLRGLGRAPASSTSSSAQSTDGGLTWSPAQTVNDAPNSATTDQFQPSVAAGPGGAVAVAFYDRRASVPERPVASCRSTWATQTPASTSRSRPTRTPERRQAPCRSAATSGSRSSPGIPTSRSRRSTGSPSTRAPDTTIRARRAAASSATTSGSRSRRQHLHVRRLDALPLANGDRRRRRARLLPAAGARHHAPIDVRERATRALDLVGGEHARRPHPSSRTTLSTRSRPSGRWVHRSTVRSSAAASASRTRVSFLM